MILLNENIKELLDKKYISGQWRALNDILNYLNTLDTNEVNKKEIYKYIFNMRSQPKDKLIL